MHPEVPIQVGGPSARLTSDSVIPSFNPRQRGSKLVIRPMRKASTTQRMTPAMNLLLNCDSFIGSCWRTSDFWGTRFCTRAGLVPILAVETLKTCQFDSAAFYAVLVNAGPLK